MTVTSNPGFVLPVTVTLALLLGLYVGAYYLLILPIREPTGEMFGLYRVPGVKGYRVSFHNRVAPWFKPAHWLDRRIRPHVWEPRP